MAHQGVIIFLSTIFLNIVDAERNIDPSKVVKHFHIEVCATFDNEEFAIDLQRCQNTCEYYGRTWDCPISYKPKGDCYCKPGFARLAEDKRCVSATKNALCVAKLPIKPESCSGPNEMYTEELDLGNCDLDCRTFGCEKENMETDSSKWSPRCICGDNEQHYSLYIPSDYRRLSNGTCVLTSDAQCVAEFQPSAERCAALGQIYKVNAPCQKSCYGEQYCPPAGGTCICPPNKLALPYDATYYTWENRTIQYSPTDTYQITERTFHQTTMITCYSIGNCPAAIFQRPPSPA